MFFLPALVLLLLLILGGVYWWREMRWRFIVIHHSASSLGNLRYIWKIHRKKHGWPDIAYHFVVNNGSLNTAPGEIEISDRWRDRLGGLSTRSTAVNTYGIAVVLVGNFEKRSMPRLQKESLIKLLVNLSRGYGVPPERIIRHRDVNRTACPGKNFDLEEIRERVRTALAKKSR